ncbi:MAG TPA: serine/threonine-protein kinase [Nannocystaceae bacterium]|nr:serine/threonine-protein kinase [Nannocystaceae bacterium]
MTWSARSRSRESILGIAMEPPSAQDLPAFPEQAGRYRLGRVLGAGAMGVVHLSHDPALDRELAIKLIAPRSGGGPRRDPTDPEGTRSRVFNTRGEPPSSATGIDDARLLEEARSLARVAHPAIVEVFDVGVCEAGVFIAMAFVDGEPLRTYVAARRLDWRTVIALHLQAGEALAAAHRVGIVHGDFKPDNVLVAANATTEDGTPRVKVVDFGLARAIGRDAPPSGEREGLTLFGTPAYLAPECWSDSTRDPSADQFAFFISLFESIVGRRPYPRSSSLASLLQNLSSGPELAQLERVTPTRLRRAIARGLDPEPSKRFATMDDALAELRAIAAPARKLGFAYVAAALVVPVGLAWVLWPKGEPPPDPAALAACDRAAETIAEVYDDASRARITAALAQQADTATRTQQLLDEYARAWSAARAQSCKAELAHDADAVALATARAQCFDERKAELAELVAQLETGEEAIARHAVRWAADLSPIAACDDAAALSRHPAWPSDAAARSRISEAYRVLARADLVAAASRPEDAVGLIDGAIAAAEASGDQGLLGRALWSRGRALALAGRYDEALAALERGYFAASERDSATAASIATELASLLGSKLARFDDAMTWVRHAETALASMGGDPGEPAARLDIVLAGIEMRRGRLDEAIAPATRARDIRAKLFGVDHYSVASAELALGSALAQQDRIADAQAHFARAREILVAALGPDHLDLAAVEHNLAMAAAKQQRFAEARAHAERSLAIRERWLSAEHPDLATSLIGLANADVGLDRLDDAQRSFQRALQIREAAFGPDHPAVAEALANVAKLASQRGDCTAATTALARALAIVQRGNDPRAQLRFERLLADTQRECKPTTAG